MTSLNTLGKTLLFTIFIFLIGCSSPDAAVLSDISPQQAATKVEAKDAVIIDVRTQGEWDAGHIPGAIHIPLSEVKDRLDEFKAYEGQTLVMQCHSGRRSANAAKILLAAGYDNVSNLTGGIIAWSKAKLPVE